MAQAAIVWLRNDLRVADNPALRAALGRGGPVVALYVHETDAGLRPIGAAARWWLHQSLEVHGKALARLGIPLEVVTGESGRMLAEAIVRHGADALFWNRRYGPAERQIDAATKARYANKIAQIASFGAHLLVEPFDIATGQGNPYAVFTPFWWALRQRDIPSPAPAPISHLKPVSGSEPVDAAYREPAWARKLAGHWAVGEAAAADALDRFLDEALLQYPEGRDVPAVEATSRLSPHLRFGEIGPRQIWHAVMNLMLREPRAAAAGEKFLSELAWRDFSYNLLFHREEIAVVPMQGRFATMPWRDDPAGLAAWQRGLTGFPIVDAGMRQLWETGWMHNRVRMLVASLLAKNLLIDWRLGERWFWDTLIDADVANNPASWQWVAGCGADAAPYFRIFNPVTQGKRFDPDGAYVRRWVPELAQLPNAWVQNPSEAPAGMLKAAGVELGTTYPRPLIDLKLSRQRALDALAAR